MTHHPIRDLPINAYCGEREWQDISTAPKGRKVLAGYFNKFGKWRTITACYHTALPWSDDQDPPEDAGEFATEGWYEESDSSDTIYRAALEPTHWMPLPAPPVIEQTGPANPECRNPDGCDRSHRMPSCRECSAAWLTLEPSERMRRRKEARAAA